MPSKKGCVRRNVLEAEQIDSETWQVTMNICGHSQLVKKREEGKPARAGCDKCSDRRRMRINHVEMESR